ncbi:XkdX family protein [Clostridium baratii]|uniref:XkdX family protein n=1 Tax=Clostridium baratii TaxID=1561 RepID=A0A174QP81_9CLOT|nr:XkdX family protein [Clostridium baratii]CUP72595.1 Uncharacterised protein [Clostridium baratii]
MNNDNFEFWKMAFDMKAIDKNLLGQAVKCDKNPFGEISPEQYEEISGEKFTLV